MPAGADLTLREQPEAHAVLLGWRAPGRCGGIHRAALPHGAGSAADGSATRKSDLAALAGVPAGQVDALHFDAPPPEDPLEAAGKEFESPFPPRLHAHWQAIGHIAGRTRAAGDGARLRRC